MLSYSRADIVFLCERIWGCRHEIVLITRILYQGQGTTAMEAREGVVKLVYVLADGVEVDLISSYSNHYHY